MKRGGAVRASRPGHASEHRAGLDGLVEGDAEVLAVDLAGGGDCAEGRAARSVDGVEVVREAARQLPEGFHLLALHLPFLAVPAQRAGTQVLARGKQVRALTPGERSSYPPCGLCM